MIDTVLEGGTIVDGTGRPRFTTDVAIVGDRIALLGDCAGHEAARRVNCRGCIVAPGFIDVSSRSSRSWLAHPAATSKIGQGITTDVGGHGDSAFFGDPAWRDADELFAEIARLTTASNVASFVDYADAARTGDASSAIRAACESGALGVSLDLRTVAHNAALDAMRAARDGGAARATVELSADRSDFVQALDDAVALATLAETSLHVLHHHVAFTPHPGAVHRTLERIDRARTRGIDVTCDIAPYVASWIDLTALVPPGLTPAALRVPDIATAATIEMQARLGEIGHEVMLAEVPHEEYASWCGSRFDEIGAAWRMSPVRAIVTLVREEPGARAFLFCVHEDDLATALSAPFCAIGTAAASYDATAGLVFGGPHPRAFGAFARTIGRFVRQRRTLALEEAIRRMTSLPAAICGIAERGTIAPGVFADVAVFDEGAFVDTATYAQPVSLPVGLTHVIVNGVFVSPGAREARYPGRVLRGGKG